MGDVYDVVVIGAGVEGSSAAYHGVKAGKRVLLLEQFPLPHSRGSSHGGTRIISFAKTAEHHQKLMDVCYPMWEELAKETNTEVLREIGVLNFCEKWTEGYPKAMLDSMKKSGAGLERLSIEERTRRFPNISYPTKPESYLYKKGGYIRANKALQCYQGEFVKNGGVLHDEEKMLEIVPGTMVTVKTNRSEYQTRSVILAPGPWASTLLKQLGLNIPLQVARCHHTFWKEKEPGMYADMPIYFDHSLTSFESSGWPSVEYPGMMKVSRWTPMPIESADDRDSSSSAHEIELSREHVREARFRFTPCPGLFGKKLHETCCIRSLSLFISTSRIAKPKLMYNFNWGCEGLLVQDGFPDILLFCYRWAKFCELITHPHALRVLRING